MLFDAITKLDCIKEYTLVGGTALSLQIGKRLSEDLDFCKWASNIREDKLTVDWPNIEREISSIGEIRKREVLGFDHVNFNVNGVKVSFFTKPKQVSPVRQIVSIQDNLKAADPFSIGVMKVELLLRRSQWRDYYDIYSLLMEGFSLKEMIAGAGIYSNHLLRSRDALNYLSNGNNYRIDGGFKLLKPYYNVDSKSIEEFIKSTIKKEYGTI